MANDKIFSKIIRGLLWFYLVFIAIYWLVNIYTTLRFGDYQIFQIGFLVFSFLGISALYAYLDNRLAGYKHFWKICLFAGIVFFLISSDSLYVGIVAILLLSPFFYGFYQLGFNDSSHQLLSLIKRANTQKFDQAIMKLERKKKYLQLSPLKRWLHSLRWEIIKISYL
ncbi:MAG TPA: hypothetical protein VMR41_06450 [Patescibacteria group bacterium]|nr:hypothetical protein [Patescibacteria group bacterium]